MLSLLSALSMFRGGGSGDPAVPGLGSAYLALAEPGRELMFSWPAGSFALEGLLDGGLGGGPGRGDVRCGCIVSRPSSRCTGSRCWLLRVR